MWCRLVEFVDEHPGGAAVILRCAGKDGTQSYDEIHEPDLVKETLPKESCLGSVGDASALQQSSAPSPAPPAQMQAPAQTPVQGRQEQDAHQSPPPLNTIISVQDFEPIAQRHLSATGWAYYSSATDDELCVDDTRRLFRKMAMRPRVLRAVEPVSADTTILGFPSSLPVYLSPTGQGKYAYRDAEATIARVAGDEGLIYCMPSGTAHEAVFAAGKAPGQKLFFQLYTGRDRERTRALLRKVEGLGAAAIFLTVDTPVLGKRERDDRVRAAEGDDTISSSSGGGFAKKASMSMLNPLLSWSDLEWIRETTKLPLVLKGVQTVEDAVLAHAHGVDGIVLSNHGGRSQDTAQAPILTLLEIRRHAPYLVSDPVRRHFQILLDGGIRRGTDVVKAVALGAAAVGIGRPILYSMCAGYGPEGLQRLCRILRTEVVTNMALAGATNVDELVPEMVNSERAERELSRRIKL